MKILIRFSVCLSIWLGLLLFYLPAAAQDSSDFDEWLADLRTEAVSRGFSATSIEQAFSEIETPIQYVVDNDRNQAEFVQTYDDYLNARLSEWRQNKGREMMATHRDLLEKIAAEYGVQPRFLVAIWGMETNFGTFPITEPLFNVLATLAYDPRRARLFRAQFFSALEILDRGFIPYEKMTGSMAGAMGQSQFIPENYLRYAVDFDGDGQRDIWESEADVLASIANYFASFGWHSDETWGRPVSLPTQAETELLGEQEDGLSPAQNCQRYRGMGVWRDLQEWQAKGVRRSDGSDLPGQSMAAAMITADANDGEGFLVYRNFCTIMRFNPAFKYALSIGLLSDLINTEE